MDARQYNKMIKIKLGTSVRSVISNKVRAFISKIILDHPAYYPTLNSTYYFILDYVFKPVWIPIKIWIINNK